MPAARKFLEAILVGAAFALAATGAFAQAFDAVRLYAAAPEKDGGTAGLAAIATYEYRGSDERRVLVVPVIDYQWANGWFAGVTNGIGFNFSNTPGVQYGFRVTADFGRDEGRADVLRGMGDIDPTGEAGAFLNYALAGGWLLTSSVRYGSGNDNKGLVTDLGAGYSSRFASRWRLGAGTTITFTNAHYTQSHFGVTNAQSVTSGYPAYAPGAGARDVRANLTLTYAIDQRASVTTVLSMSRLLGDAADSPLARKHDSTSAVVAFAYAF